MGALSVPSPVPIPPDQPLKSSPRQVASEQLRDNNGVSRTTAEAKTFDSSLGDYTQWVHSACPPSKKERKRKTSTARSRQDTVPFDMTDQTERRNSTTTTQFKDYSRLPAVHRSLGDYTQWVHLAFPHSSKNWQKHPVGVQT